MQNFTTAPGTWPSADNGARISRRVCDQCRLRKIRCNRVQPCSNCTTAKRACAFTGAGRKTKPQHEAARSAGHAIDVESRLASVESILRDLSRRLAPSPSMTPPLGEPDRSHHVPEVGSSLTVNASRGSEPDDPDPTSLSFACEPILAEQSTFASNLLQNALRESPICDTSPKMQSALADLCHIVELQSSPSSHEGISFPLEQPIPQGGLSQMPMPPLRTVVALWTRLKGDPPTIFTSLCTIVGVTDFPSLCRLLYFPSADFSDATFAAVNICLYYMFSEQNALIDEAESKKLYASYINMCQQNLETGLSNLRLFSMPTAETLVALILGTIYAIGHSRPAVAWTLNCAAAQICQTPGFRPAAGTGTIQNKGLDLKSIALWHIYVMDSALGLRLGRAPILHDWDTAMPGEQQFRDVVGMTGLPTLWLKLATIQRKIYCHLYSRSALACPSEELVDRARRLAEECRALEIENSTSRSEAVASFERMQASPIVGTLVSGDEVQLLSTMTLVYRAIPPANGNDGIFSQECILTARKAMEKHQDCMGMLKDDRFVKTTYAHWNLLLLPFTPFFVLFCHVIEKSSELDLQLVRDFTSSLQHFSDISPTMEKLWRLCRAMSAVAEMYVEAKSHRQDENARAPSNDFDEYLGQLGFIPGDEILGQGVEDVASWNMQAVQNMDWLARSRNMMDLLQQDLLELGG